MMNMLINHCWCADSNWGGIYDCTTIVSIDRVPKGKKYHEGVTDDWKNLIDGRILSDEDTLRLHAYETKFLKPEVMEWLKENIKDRNRTEGHHQGWAVGTDDYNVNSRISFPVFFDRPWSALKFIKKWSSYKKPIDYLNYFQDVRREYDFSTGRMKRVPRWTNV